MEQLLLGSSHLLLTKKSGLDVLLREDRDPDFYVTSQF